MYEHRHSNHSLRGTAETNANWALFTLFLVATLNVLDRYIIFIIQEPLKADLGLTDTQLGSLTGLAFAIVYCLAGLPIARLADRSNRVRLIAVAVAAWSALTALSGLATGFTMLIVLRMGVAIGEAGNNPASLSLLSDYFPAQKRPVAFAIWHQCMPLGTAIGFLAGGFLTHLLGWRGTLFTVGLIGLLFVPLMLWLKEPQRGRFDHGYTPAPPLPLRRLWKELIANRALRYLIVGAGCHGFVLNGIQAWSAPFYARVFSFPIDQLAFYLTIIIGLAGGLGVMLGGVLAHWLQPKNVGWLTRIPALGSLVSVPLLLGQLFVPSAVLSLCLGFLATISLSVHGACINVAAQSLVPPTARATVVIATSFAMVLFGLSLGPMTVGIVSDVLTMRYGLGVDSLRFAVAAALIGSPFAAYFFFRSTTFLERTGGAAAKAGPAPSPPAASSLASSAPSVSD